MSKNPTQQTWERKKRNDTAKIIASIARVSPAYVRMVMNGDKENDDILTASILYEQGKSRLIQEVKKLVPFNN